MLMSFYLVPFYLQMGLGTCSFADGVFKRSGVHMASSVAFFFYVEYSCVIILMEWTSKEEILVMKC